MLHAHLAALALAASALAASGCGSSSKNGSTSASAGTSANTTTVQSSNPAATVPVAVASGKPLTHAQWIAKGDAICARLSTQLAENTAKTQPELAYALAQGALYTRAALTQLAKLVPPSPKETDWQEFLTGLEEMASNSTTLSHITQAGNFNVKLPLLAATELIQKRIQVVSKHNGFKHCSRI